MPSLESNQDSEEEDAGMENPSRSSHHRGKGAQCTSSPPSHHHSSKTSLLSISPRPRTIKTQAFFQQNLP